MPLTAVARNAEGDWPAGRYQRHRPEQILLYRIVEEYYPAFATPMAVQGRELPCYVQREFEDYLRCGCLEHGFLRVRCESCHAEQLVAFSCKRCGFCPSCGARRMAESAALLVDEVLPQQPMRQWVLSFPYPYRHVKSVKSRTSPRHRPLNPCAVSGSELPTAAPTPNGWRTCPAPAWQRGLPAPLIGSHDPHERDGTRSPTAFRKSTRGAAASARQR